MDPDPRRRHAGYRREGGPSELAREGDYPRLDRGRGACTAFANIFLASAFRLSRSGAHTNAAISNNAPFRLDWQVPHSRDSLSDCALGRVVSRRPQFLTIRNRLELFQDSLFPQVSQRLDVPLWDLQQLPWIASD